MLRPVSTESDLDSVTPFRKLSLHGAYYVFSRFSNALDTAKFRT